MTLPISGIGDATVTSYVDNAQTGSNAKTTPLVSPPKLHIIMMKNLASIITLTREKKKHNKHKRARVVTDQRNASSRQ